MTLFDSPAVLRFILAMLVMFFECSTIYIMFKNFQQKRSVFIRLHDILILCINLAANQLLANVADVHSGGQERLYFKKLAYMPLWAFILFLIADVVVIYFKMRRIRLVQEKRLTRVSIRQAMDAIPDGLCCYTPLGIPRLVNRQMERLCWELMDEPMSDAAQFWDNLCHGRLKNEAESVRGGNTPIIRLSDGRVISFTRKSFKTDGYDMYELMATDITSVFEITTALRESNRRLTEMNKRLKQVSESITQMTIDKEVLDTKIAIHDNLGSMLLATKRHLLVGHKAKPIEYYAERRELIDSWRQNVYLLLHEKAETRTDEYILIEETAADVGMSIHIEGELPGRPEIKKIVATAMHECLTNTMRHAKGDTLFIRSCLEKEASGETAKRYGSDVYSVIITNNGLPPKGPVSESGGLGSLRELVNKYGGEMATEWKPEFVLRLILPVRQ